MKFNIRIHGRPVEPAIIEQALLELDPAAILDYDEKTSRLRFSSCLDAHELMALMTATGFPVPDADLEGLPSECCGGCGG